MAGILLILCLRWPRLLAAWQRGDRARSLAERKFRALPAFTLALAGP